MLNISNLPMNIKVARLHNGLSQKKMSEQLGISQDTISLWETGKQCPSIKHLIDLSQILETDIYTLLEDG